MRHVSVVFSTFNEMSSGYIQRSLKLLADFRNIEVIAVDGGSTDGTLEFLESLPIQLLRSEHKTRAKRLNFGIQSASHKWILLHHPRSLLTHAGLMALSTNEDISPWGAFTHKFDFDHPLLRFTSWYSNRVRGDLRHIYYLDHCIFFNRNLFADNATEFIPDLAIFEDTALCLKLRPLAKPQRLPFDSLTSSIRFQKNGIWRQSLLNQIIKIGFLLNFSNDVMNKIYEKGLSLNTKYK